MIRRDTLVTYLVRSLFVMGGLQIAWFVPLVLGEKTVSSFIPYQWRQVYVDPSGRLVVEQLADGEPRYTTTDGKPLDVPKDNYWLDGARLSAPPGDKELRRRLPWGERLGAASEFTRPPVTWFLVHSPIAAGDAYLVGYNQMSNAVVGYIDRNGYRTTPPPRDEWFPVIGSGSYGRQAFSFREASGSASYSGSLVPHESTFLVSGGQVWKLDLSSRTADAFYPSRDAVSVATSPIVLQAPPDQAPEDWRGGPFYKLSGAGVLVRTPTQVVGVDFKGRQRAAWTIPDDLRSQDFAWYELADGTAVIAERGFDATDSWTEYHWVDEQGTVRSEKVSLGPPSPAYEKYWVAAAVVPQTFIMTFISCLIEPWQAVERAYQPDFPTALAQSITNGWTAMLAVYVLSLGLAVLAYRRQARFALPGPVAWALFVFLFGLPGWMAYRWHRHWPVLEACSECRQPAPRDRETCAACGQLFAPPPLVGTEIFA